MRAFKVVTSDGEHDGEDFEEIKAIFHEALKGTLKVEAVFEIAPSGKEMLAEAIAYAINSVVSGEADITFWGGDPDCSKYPRRMVLIYEGDEEKLDFGVIERLIISELWHALNRRKMVPNDVVDSYISKTYERLLELRTAPDFQ